MNNKNESYSQVYSKVTNFKDWKANNIEQLNKSLYKRGKNRNT